MSDGEVLCPRCDVHLKFDTLRVNGILRIISECCGSTIMELEEDWGLVLRESAVERAVKNLEAISSHTPTATTIIAAEEGFDHHGR